MPIFLREGQKVLFKHVPKCAGSSIEALMAAEGFTVLLLSDAGGADVPCPPQHLHHAALLAMGVASTSFDFEFAVVRHPLERLISEYFFRGMDARGISFTAFVNYVLWGASLNMYFLSNHIRPQVEFLSEKTRIYRYEDSFDPIIDDLQSIGLIGDGVTVPHKKKRKSQGSVVVSRQAASLINRFYYRDFVRLGYQPLILDEFPESGVVSYLSTLAVAGGLLMRQKTKEIFYRGKR